MAELTGSLEQTPPAFSAKKRSAASVRMIPPAGGEVVENAPVRVEVSVF